MHDVPDQLRRYADALTDRLDPVVPVYPTAAPARRRWPVVAVGAAAALVAVAVVIARVDDDGAVTRATSTGPATAAWRDLPDAPIEPMEQAVVVWTGEEVVVAGGRAVTEAAPGSGDGVAADPSTGATTPIAERTSSEVAAYDPTAGTWRRLPDAPVAIWATGEAVWTGDRLLWLGSDGESAPVLAVLEVATATWTVVPVPGGAGGALDLVGAWTGDEALFWGHRYHDPSAPAFAAAYDPEARRWRSIAPGPLRFREGAAGVWTGEELIVWGGEDVVGNLEGPEGAAYDPATDSWRLVPASPIGPRRSASAVWTGEEMVVWGGTTGPSRSPATVAFDPASDRWRRLADSPSATAEPAAVVWTGTDLVVVGGLQATAGESSSDTAALRAADGTWRVLPDPPGPSACRAAAVWTGREVVVWGGNLSCATPTRAPERGTALSLGGA